MSVITVRGLEDAVQAKIERWAASSGRTVESEARAILTEATVPPSTGAGIHAALKLFDVALADAGISDFDLPPRRTDYPRPVSFA
ncbi:MAG: hypothetical protein LBM66_07630 [Bifidobacteriaceae bacterium]|jgi:plasmid stability protein|nr:hypothetical protein [Bifidobacteriaceae bacterium]